MMLFTLKHVFQYGEVWWDYYQKNQKHIRPVVVDNIIKMLSCGQSVRGHACYTCPNPECSHIKYVIFTCKSRFCPSCGKKATEAWIQRQMAILPQTEWQHITFTMPKTLWRLFSLNRHLLNKLPALAAKIIKTITKQKNIIPGIFIALHTFGRDLKWNPHVHLSTTRGGLTKDHETWKSIYFKKNILMEMWRYEVVTLLRNEYKNNLLTLPKSLHAYCPNYTEFSHWLNRRYQQRWIIHCAKPSKAHYHNVNYLGRYIKRPPIAQSRLKHYDGNNVVFRYLNHKNQQHSNFTCSAHQFIKRFTQHIPEKGFRLIRYYGFLANRTRGALLKIVYQLLGKPESTDYPPRWNILLKKEIGFDPLKCILCNSRMQLGLLCVGYNSQQLHGFHKELALMKKITA